MKKVVAAFALFFMVAEINFPVEARLNLLQKIGDVVKGRKSNDDTKSLDKIVGNIKGLGSSFGSSGSAQFKYANSKFLTTTSDLSFLMAYSSFAKNGELFFSLIESLLGQMRTEYTTLLGAQNKANNTTNEQTRQKQEDKAELSSSNMQRCLDVLMSGGVQALQANLQCSSIVLLRVIQELGEVPQSNQQTVRKQIEALNKKCSLESINYISENLASSLASVREISEFSEDTDSQAEVLVKNISLVQSVLGVLSRFVNGEDFSSENRRAEIDEILNTVDYYSGFQGEYGEKSSSSNDDDESSDDRDYDDDDEETYYDDEDE